MDLDLKRVIASKPKKHDVEPLAPLSSPWGEKIDFDHVLEEHPRPQMRRGHWQSLNGFWDYAIVHDEQAALSWKRALPPEQMGGQILVPFSPETRLSGVEHTLMPNELLWYRRVFRAPALANGERLILHLEAVDWACAIYVNGQPVAEHVGGYTPIDVEVTQALTGSEELLEVCVFDPSDQAPIVRGKQRLSRGDIWYSAQSGIWQSAWLEVVPASYVRDLQLLADADNGRLVVRASVTRDAEEGELPHFAARLCSADGQTVAMGSCVPGRAGRAVMTLALDQAPHLWSCEDPYLYNVEVSFGADRLWSYCAFRTCTIEKDDAGVERFCLNHEPLFLRGILDQGYWPESLMTAPSDEALIADIEAVRSLGFNMIRKHIKIESARWYWHCDRLGMLVFQDMVSGGLGMSMTVVNHLPALSRFSWRALGDRYGWQRRILGSADPGFRKQWQQSFEESLRLLAGHPCIISWTIFNEGWGQFDAVRAYERLREIDPTRPADVTSGWFDQGVGDYLSIHNYFRTLRVYPDRKGRAHGAQRAFLLSEFGGLTLHVEGHSSCSQAYGYEAFESARAWRGGLRALLEEVDALWEKGLAGFVYSQLSDIEEEVNGLITYDRRINKVTGERMV